MTIDQLRALSREQWLSAMLKYAPRAVGTLAIVGIAWQLSQLTWLALEPKPDSNAVQTLAPPLKSATASNSGVNAQAIADAHLFGLPAADKSDTDPNNLPQSQINLVLAGTIAFANPEAGFAIVGENASSAKFYRVGTTINGAARLHSVYTDRVIIDRAGVLETLALPHGPGISMNPPRRAVVNAPNPVADNIRRLVATNPGVLTQMIRAQPVFTNGTQKGYRIYPGRDRAQFARLGLQPGDLITAINGTLLDDPNPSNDVLSMMSSSSTISVSIERNGSTQQLNLDMSQISLPEDNVAPAAAEPPTDAVGPPPLNRPTRAPLRPDPNAPSAQ